MEKLVKAFFVLVFVITAIHVWGMLTQVEKVRVEVLDKERVVDEEGYTDFYLQVKLLSTENIETPETSRGIYGRAVIGQEYQATIRGFTGITRYISELN